MYTVWCGYHFYFNLDTNECAGNNGGCGQICTNTIGGFTCSCNDGYDIDTDQLGCAGKIYTVTNYNNLYEYIMHAYNYIIISSQQILMNVC